MPFKSATGSAKLKNSTSQAKRAASEEIGDEPPTKINKVTGRPIRRSAGRKTLDSGFVKTIEAIEKSDDESSEEDDSGKYHRPKKRPRSPRPPSLSPLLEIKEDPLDESLVQSLQLPPQSTTPNELALTFHVPPGHQGAFVVKLDLASVLAGGLPIETKPTLPVTQATKLRGRANASKITPKSKTKRMSQNVVALGFLDLPGELRNVIYRLVFVDEKPFDFHTPTNFQHSSAFLRTCRTIRDEGTQILYSENSFIIERQSKPRANYWTPTWTEVGFKDVRLWLSSIGEVNISHLRDLHMVLEDASPSGNPQLTTPEERRYVHDETLIQCLKLLAHHGSLKTISFTLHGRKSVQRSDFRFLDHLKAIQADSVKFALHPRMGNIVRWSGRPHYGDPGLENILKSKMERGHKLYK